MPFATHQKERRKEVRRTVAGLNAPGLLRLRKRISKASGAEDAHCSRLRQAFEKLGPLFCGFGIYLSSRIDLLPVSYIREFSLLSDNVPPVPAEWIRKVIRGELGNDTKETYFAFEDQPLESRIAFQSHNACLSDGTPVTIKVSRAALNEHFIRDIDMLPMLAAAFEPLGINPSQFKAASLDFERSLDQQLNLKYHADALERLFEDSKEFQSLGAVLAYPDLSTARLLTIRRLKHTQESMGALAPDAVSNLAIAWLCQALMGSVMPVDVIPQNLTIVSENRFAFNEGFFTRLSADTKSNLWRYLVAASANDPDSACTFLLREFEGESSDNEGRLRNALRQAVTCRDSSWRSEHDENNLATQLFMQLRLAIDLGFIPLPATVAFFRGLYRIVQFCERVSMDRDWLVEAVQEVRLVAELRQIREMTTGNYLWGELQKYAAVFIDLPKKVDESLLTVTEGNLLLKTSTRIERKRSGNRAVIWLILVGIAGLLTLLATFAGYLSVRRVNTILIITLGLILLSRRAPIELG